MKAKVPTFPFAVPRKINDGRLPRDFDPWWSVPVIRVIHKRHSLRDKTKIVKDEFRFPSATSPSFHREYNPETGSRLSLARSLTRIISRIGFRGPFVVWFGSSRIRMIPPAAPPWSKWNFAKVRKIPSTWISTGMRSPLWDFLVRSTRSASWSIPLASKRTNHGRMRL